MHITNSSTGLRNVCTFPAKIRSKVANITTRGELGVMGPKGNYREYRVRCLVVLIMFCLSFVAVANDDQYIKCIVAVQSYDAKYQWHSEEHGSFDDGVAPLATFKIVEPVKYSSKTVSILFNSQLYKSMLPSLKSVKMQTYSILLPVNFLTSEANVISASNSMGLLKYGP